MALFGKTTPKYIEATVFAILTCLINTSAATLQPLVGVIINDNFVNVSNENMSNFY